MICLVSVFISLLHSIALKLNNFSINKTFLFKFCLKKNMVT